MNQESNLPPMPLTEIALAIIGLLALQRGWVYASSWLESVDAEAYQPELFTIFFWLQIVALSVSVILFGFIVYAIMGITRIRREEQERMEKLYEEHTRGGTQEPINPEWERIKARLEADNPSEWRLAILDADVLLERMVDRMQYQGDTLSDKLKQIEQSDFTTINAAWEAHKIRNRIAHEGEDFILTQREARRIVGLYEQVFREFHYV